MYEILEGKVALVLSLQPFLLDGLWSTFRISVIALFLGSSLGFMLGMLRSLRIMPITAIIGFYLHLFRGSPFLVQLYVFYFVFPSLGVEFLAFESFTAAIVALSLYTSSYVTEITTAAIQAVPRGQEEAARSVGMTKWQAMYHVVVPQALKLMIPPMGSVYVIMIKSTALLSVIGISELTRQGEIAILRHPGDILFIYMVVAVFYFVYCYPVLRFARWAEEKVGAVGVKLD